MNLLVTSDTMGSSGATVVYNELEALKTIGPTDVLNPIMRGNPFETDDLAYREYKRIGKKYRLAHFYSGSYSKLISELKKDGTKITYTVAAHDVDLSREEHEKLGLPFDYPHLNIDVLFKQYTLGYKESDIVICPSILSKNLMHKYGCQNVEVIPHGCHLPSEVTPLPSRFSVGYLGQGGADKGLLYLVQAWASLNYPDCQLVIAGSGCQVVLDIIRKCGRGSIFLAGYIPSVATLYNSCSVYVQPSVTEGFGMEVIEAMSYGRPVICSDGAGAAGCITSDVGMVVPKRDSEALADAIGFYKNNPANSQTIRQHAVKYSWDVAKAQYCGLWNRLLETQ